MASHRVGRCGERGSPGKSPSYFFSFEFGFKDNTCFPYYSLLLSIYLAHGRCSSSSLILELSLCFEVPQTELAVAVGSVLLRQKPQFFVRFPYFNLPAINILPLSCLLSL